VPVNLSPEQPLVPLVHLPPTFTTGGGSFAFVVAGVFEAPPECAVFDFFDEDFVEVPVVVPPVTAEPAAPVAGTLKIWTGALPADLLE
jgi:hypothetical protein